VLVAALVVDSAGSGLFAPLSLIYFERLTDVPLALIGVLLTVANLVALPVPIWAGVLADRFGPRPLVVAAQVLVAAGFLGYSTVTGPVGIVVTATLVGIGVRVFWCVVFTLLADHADGTPDGRSTDGWYAIANAARTAGLAIGGLVTGAVLADGRVAAYRLVALLAAGCFAAAAVLIAAFVRAPRRGEAGDRSGYRELLRDRPFLGLVGLNTVYAMSSMMLALALPTVVLGAAGPPWLTSVLLAANAVLITAVSAPVVRRLDGVRRTRSIAAAALLWTAWCAMLALVAVLPPGATVPLVALLAAATLLFTLAEAVHAPISTALAASLAPPSARGRYLASFQYSFAVASVIGPAFFASLYVVGPAWPFVVLGALDALSVFGLAALGRALARTAPTVRRGGGPGGAVGTGAG
jgi:MFS family permease